jgi:hypothetical protein
MPTHGERLQTFLVRYGEGEKSLLMGRMPASSSSTSPGARRRPRC